MIFLITTIAIILYFVKIALYGDEERFFVMGAWKPGLFGMFLSSIALIIASRGNYITWPLVLIFLVCCIITYFKNSPVVLVNGDEATFTSPKHQITFTKESGSILIGPRCMVVRDSATGAEFIVRSSSLNYKKLLNWVLKNPTN